MSAWGNALIRMFLFVCVPLQCCLPGWILWCRHLCKYLLLCMPPLFPPGVILFTSLLPVSSSRSVGQDPRGGSAGQKTFSRGHHGCYGVALVPSFTSEDMPPKKIRRFSGVKLKTLLRPPLKQKIAGKFSVWSVCLQYNIWDKSWSYQP